MTFESWVPWVAFVFATRYAYQEATVAFRYFSRLQGWDAAEYQPTCTAHISSVSDSNRQTARRRTTVHQA